MQVNIREFLEECGLDEPLYPGKRLVHRLPQSGNRSHAIIYDWRASELLRIEIKAGLSGKDLPPRDLKKYPVCFQSPTYLEIDTANDDDEEEDEEERQGKSGGGGKKMKKKKKEATTPFQAFSQVVEGKIPDIGKVQKLVVMGMDIAKNAYESVIKALAAQIKDKAVRPVNVLAEAKTMNVTVATPSGGLDPKGHETQKYEYKGADMFQPGGPS